MIDEISFCNRGIIIDDTFIISDTHIGYFNNIDSMTIKDEQNDILDRIENVTKKSGINKLVINGDVFHEFKTPSIGSKQIYNDIRTILEANNCDLIPISGNHDEKSNNSPKSKYNFDNMYSFDFNNKDVVITHGHEKLENKRGDLYILGHIHPILNINGVKWPTYLYGNVQDKYSVLISPCFSTYQDGVIISENMDFNINFPYVKSKEFYTLKPYIYDSNKNIVRKFPELSELKNYL